jgi:asparagine synthase (glutamine-hydrolysing)
VILAGFEEWGIPETVGRLNGMFAVAVFDQTTRRIHLFRDRLGVKPLFYQWHGGALYFSSELTQPFAGIGRRSINRDALALYFRHYYIPAPHTIYDGIRKLLPAVIATASPESASQGRFEATEEYWNTRERINGQLASLDGKMGMEEALDLLDGVLTRSVSRRMIADVPLGAFLSGGIDSSLITAYMQKNSLIPVKTFTIGFEDETYNEAESARKIAEYLGTEHTEFYVTDQEAREVIPRLPAMYGEPFADSSQIPTYLVSKLTRRKVTVALSGDGGDELFAGYRLYRTLARINKYQPFIPSGLVVLLAKGLSAPGVQRRVQGALGPDAYRLLAKALRLCAGPRENEIHAALNDHILNPETLVIGCSPGSSSLPLKRCKGNYTEQLMCDNLMVYMPDDILVKVDRASMATALEVRAPFTDDWELFDAAWRIPFRLKHQGGEGKVVLKRLLARHLPRELFERPKQGFAVPLRSWLHGPLSEWVGDSLSPDRISREGYLDPRSVEMIRERSRKSDAFASALWAICMFQSWLAEFGG